MVLRHRAKGNMGYQTPPFHGAPGQPVWVRFELYLANEFASGGFNNADFDRLKVDVVSPEKSPFPCGKAAIWPPSGGAHQSPSTNGTPMDHHRTTPVA